MQGLVCLSPPLEEPVSLDEARAHLRLDGSTFDDALSRLITAARQLAERETNRQLCTATWQLSLDAWPREIRLPKPPLLDLEAIEYVDPAGDLQTLDAGLYELHDAVEPARIVPAYGEVWPDVRDHINVIRVRYDAGYGDAENVPAPIKQFILLLVAHWFVNPSAVVTGITATELPRTTDYLIDPYRMPEFSS